MTESTPFGAAGADALPNDIDPRFDSAASGTEPPRPDPAAAAASAQDQFAEIAAACRTWVRDKPLQAVGLAVGLGFLVGRSGR